MATVSSSTPAIYLAKQDGELVLQQGENPNQSKHADQRVLIIGGGVTGLTVSSVSFRVVIPATYANNNAECLGSSRRRLLSDRCV